MQNAPAVAPEPAQARRVAVRRASIIQVAGPAHAFPGSGVGEVIATTTSRRSPPSTRSRHARSTRAATFHHRPPDVPYLASKVAYPESNGQITRRVLIPGAD